MSRPARLRWALACAVALACRKEAPQPTLYDLAALAPAAELTAPAEVVRFGLPQAERHQRSGLVVATGEPDDDPHVRGRRRFEIAFDWPRPVPRRLMLDMAPMTGLDRQACALRLNGADAGRVELGSRRSQQLVAWPEPLQAAGTNVAAFTCDEAAERQGSTRHRYAVRLYTAAVAEGASTVPTSPYLSVRRDGEVATVHQAGASELRFMVAVQEGTTFSAEVSGAGSVAVELPGEARRELWSGSSGPVKVGLPASPALRLVLVARGEGVTAWRAPRIGGAGVPDPRLMALEPAPAMAPKELARPRNVVLVILDAASARHFGAYGYGRKTTPNVDRLAAEGVLFEDAYSPAGYTILAMGSLWTSQHPDELHNGAPPDAMLPREATTVPVLLAARGFATAGFVRNTQAGRARRMERGFAVFEEDFRGLGHRASALRSVVPEWLRANRERPFFLYVHFREPHFPYNPPPPFDTLFGPRGRLPARNAADPVWLREVNAERSLGPEQRQELERLYDGNLAFVDGEVGALRAALEKEGRLEDTALVVTADHGESMGEHGFVGHEAEVYGEVTHIPVVLRLPHGPRGLRVPGLVDLADLGATIADLGAVGDDPAARRSFRGRSLLRTLGSPPAGRPFVVSRTPDENPRYAFRDPAFVYHLDTRLGREELYDAVADRGERTDLSGRDPFRTAFYRQALARFVLEKRRGRASAAEEEAALSPEQRENLRALGYTN